MSIIGSILGDIAGSQYEFGMSPDRDPATMELFTEHSRYTDDTVMTIATKAALIDGKSFTEMYQKFGREYPDAGYGGLFYGWIFDEDPQPYGSFGNGSAMRVSYVADHFDNIEDVKLYAKMSAACSHNDPEGIKGAVVTAVCAFMVKHGWNKDNMLAFVNTMYPRSEYTFSSERSLDDIRETYTWSGTCQDSVPVAMRCVYEADSYIGFIRNVFSLDCDMDTLCAIGGSVAEELFGGTGLDDRALLEKYLPEELLKIVYKNN